MSLFEIFGTVKQHNMVTHTHTIKHPAHAVELNLQTWLSSFFISRFVFLTFFKPKTNIPLPLNQFTQIKALLDQVICLYTCTERLGICAVTVDHGVSRPLIRLTPRKLPCGYWANTAAQSLAVHLKLYSCRWLMFVFERRKVTRIKQNSWNDLYLKPG